MVPVCMAFGGLGWLPSSTQRLGGVPVALTVLETSGESGDQA